MRATVRQSGELQLQLATFRGYIRRNVVMKTAVFAILLTLSILASSTFGDFATITFVESPLQYKYIDHGPLMSRNGQVVTGVLTNPLQPSLPNMGILHWTAATGSKFLDFSSMTPDPSSHVGVFAV